MPASASSHSSEDSSSQQDARSRSRSHSSSAQRGRRGGRGSTQRNQKILGGGGRPRVQREYSIQFPPMGEPLWELEQFMNEHRGKDFSEDKLRRLYSSYKRQWDNHQKEESFEKRKLEVWIQDKYHPEKRYLLQEERFKESRQAYDQFVSQLNLGKLNSINLTVKVQSVLEIASGIDVSQQLENREAPFAEIQVKELLDLSDHYPYFANDPNEHTLFIKAIPSDLSRWDILEAVQTLPGFLNFSVSAPVKANEDQRMGWIGFESEHDVAQALSSNIKVKGFQLNLSKQQERRKTVRVCSTINPKRLYKDYRIQRDLIQALDKEKKIEGNPLTQGPAKDKEDPLLMRQLDLQTLYLRRVHCYCYWSGGEFQSERVLNQKCGNAFLRIVNEGFKTASDGLDWQKAIQKLAKKRIQNSSEGLTVIDPLQVMLDKEVQSSIKNKKNSKQGEIYPCNQCTKQFKGPGFLAKHMSTKHPEEYQQMIDNIIDTSMTETFKLEKQSKMLIQKVIFGVASFKDEKYEGVKIVSPINFAPRPQQRAYKDLDNIQTERTIPQNIVIPLKESTINYHDI